MAGKDETIYVRVEAWIKQALEAEAGERGEAAAVVHREILRRHYQRRARRSKPAKRPGV